MTYSTPDLSEATREMIRRANRWGGTWVVVPHPMKPGEYGVGAKNIVPGVPVKEYAGGNINDLIRDTDFGRRRHS